MKLSFVFVLCVFINSITLSQNNITLTVNYCESCVKAELHKEEKLIFNDTNSVNKHINNILLQLYSKSFLLAYSTIQQIDSLNYNAKIYCKTQLQLAKLNTGNIDPKALKLADFSKYKNLKYFDVNELTYLIKNIAKWYENNGYPFVTIKLDNIILKDESIEADLFAEKGKKIRINSIINKGNLEINHTVLEFIIEVFEEGLYNNSKIKNIENRVKKFDFITMSRATEINFYDDSCNIILYFDKRSSNTFDGILGLMTDYENDNKLNIIGELNLNLVNSLSYAERLRINWRRPSRNSQDLKTYVIFPSILIAPFGVSWGFNLNKNENDFLNVDNIFNLHYSYKQKNLSAYIRTQSTSLLEANVINSVLPEVSDMKATMYGLTFNFNNYDNKFNPSKGIELELDFSAGVKEIMPNPNVNDSLYKMINLKQFRANMRSELSLFVPITSNTSFFVSNTSAFLSSENIFLNEMYRLGGLHLMRGFHENLFYASTFTVQTIGYKLIFGKQSSISVFADKAYIEQKTKNNLRIFRPLALGLEANFETNSGILSIVYAIGKQQKQSFMFNASKIHIGFSAFF